MAGQPSTLPKAGRNDQRFAPHHYDAFVPGVCDEHELLLWILREGDVPGGTAVGAAFRGLRDEGFLQILAVLLKDLNPILCSIANVDEAVLCNSHAAHVSE